MTGGTHGGETAYWDASALDGSDIMDAILDGHHALHSNGYTPAGVMIDPGVMAVLAVETAQRFRRAETWNGDAYNAAEPTLPENTPPGDVRGTIFGMPIIVSTRSDPSTLRFTFEDGVTPPTELATVDLSAYRFDSARDVKRAYVDGDISLDEFEWYLPKYIDVRPSWVIDIVEAVDD